MKKKLLAFLVLFISLMSLSACGRLLKSDQTLLKGDWEEVDSLPASKNSDLLELFIGHKVNFGKIEAYHFDAAKHELSFSSLAKFKVSFDYSGNVLTLTNEASTRKTSYYRKNSGQYKKAKTTLQKKIDSINETWRTQHQSYLEKFEKAMAGSWSNAAANARVNLNHDSPDPDAKLIISKPKFLIFEASFYGAARPSDGDLSVKYENQKISNAKIQLPEEDLATLLGARWNDADQLDKSLDKIKNLSFRDFFMKLGEVTLTYTVPSANLKQNLTVPANRATVAPNLISFEECNVTSYDLANNQSFTAYLSAESE